MKKISKLLACALVLCMGFSTVAFAAEDEVTVEENLQQEFSDYTNEVEIVPLAAAPPITRAAITDIKQEISTGTVYAYVDVTGYGSTFGYLDGVRVPLSKTTNVGSPVVTGFRYEFNCGVLSSGTYTFRYSGTSYNKPWNTVNLEVTFTVP